MLETSIFSFIPQYLEQEGQYGPGSLTWIFEITLANFSCFVAFREELKEFLYVRTLQVAPIH